MALTTEQKRETVENFINSVDSDIFNTDLQLTAAKAELEAGGEEEKQGLQANVDNLTRALSRLNARRTAWETELKKYSKGS